MNNTGFIKWYNIPRDINKANTPQISPISIPIDITDPKQITQTQKSILNKIFLMKIVSSSKVYLENINILGNELNWRNMPRRLTAIMAASDAFGRT